MKVYLVFRSQGSYDDYVSFVYKATLEIQKATEIMNFMNEKIERIKNLSTELQLKDGHGRLSYDDPNWTRHYYISELGKCWIEEHELV